MRLLWLPAVLRAAGLTVYEVPGWQTRGGDTFDPKGGICHATAGSATSTDAGEINVLLYGSNTAPPPIAQLYLSRSGAFHVVASGRCNHALTGQPGTPLQGLGNTNLIGIEAQNNNAGQPWTPAQLDAYVRGCAAIARKMGWSASRWIAHREHQPSGKSDPVGINMTTFRASVAALIANPGGTDMQLSDPNPFGPSPAQFTREDQDHQLWLMDGQHGNVGVLFQYILENSHFARIFARRADSRVAALSSVVEQLAEVIRLGGGSVDTATILNGVDERLAAFAAETRDAVADLGEGGAAQVRGPQS